ncbi:hypothetical protein [Methyloferula stellata]|uniref:hypothetical protein n=1 Tax=Methyloferula stellata TaxID=876270 RepID=UPI000382DE93|nr:hypothetical protein [Methyloferula stellata]
MLTLKQFTAMLDSYGADPQRWPENLRAEAEALLDRSEQARRSLADALALDDAMRSASAREEAKLWQPGDQDAALARLRSGVAARIASTSYQRPNRSLAWTLFGGMQSVFSPRLAWVGVGASGGIAVVAGLLIGAAYSAPSASDNLMTMLQPDPIQILAD